MRRRAGSHRCGSWSTVRGSRLVKVASQLEGSVLEGLLSEHPFHEQLGTRILSRFTLYFTEQVSRIMVIRVGDVRPQAP